MILPRIESVGIYNSKTVGADGKTTKNRVCSMFEIELPISCGGISYMDGESAEILTDMVILAKPGQSRHTKFPFSCYFVHTVLSGGYLLDTLMSLPSFIKISDREPYERIYKELCRYYNTYTRRDEIRVESLMLELIHRLAVESEGQSRRAMTESGSFLSVERALEYIKLHLGEELTLKTVSEQVNLNPVYFHNLFKKALGKTLRDYIEEQRIKKAVHLLCTTDMTLTDISYECGFSSQSYFSYVFKRRMKVTPRGYAKEIYDGK